MARDYTFYVYILTNPSKSTLYIGFTNSLVRRLSEHKENRGKPKTFAGRNYCYLLIYYEVYQYVNNAIAREKQLKKWSRAKKEALIATMNPQWNSLNINFINVED
jgi:putative endonuclease